MPSPSPCASLYNTRLDTPQAMCVLRVALRGTHPRAKMRRTSGRMLKKPASGGKDDPVSPLCSRNARSQKTLAWATGTSRRASGWAGEKSGLVEHPAGTIPCCATQTDRLVLGFNMLFS